MPQLGETVTEGTITKWLVKVGERVEIDQPLFEVSTDKVDSEVPSTISGYLTEILVPEGETVDVGKPIARIEEKPQAASAAPSPAPKVPVEPEPAPQAAQEPPAPQAPAYQAAQAYQPVQAAPESTVPDSGVDQTERQYRAAVGASNGHLSGSGARQSVDDYDDLVLSPVVRHLIVENGLDPHEIKGTGVGGRITRADVLAVLDARARSGVGRAVSGTAGTAPAGTAPAGTAGSKPMERPQPPVEESGPRTVSEEQKAPASQTPAIRYQAPAVASQQPQSRPDVHPEITVGSRDYVVPFNNIRRRTAEHMVRSKSTSAHTLMSIEVDFEQVERVRSRNKDQFKAEEGFSLTYLPFIVRATVEAIKAYPNINASVLGDSLVIHRDVNIAIAVDLNLEGLIAPVIHSADSKRLTGIAREIHDLAYRARTKKLNADDIAGGTFTITNPGPFGTFMTGAIINQPQVAILATDAVKRRPVVITAPDGSESIGIHSVGLLTVNFDHRAVDGAYAAAFLAKEKQVIETWNWDQEL
jgi:2-oxoglutarate dehydrogenase E2 component (dihydrolipoamide succinyltransferase)